MKVLFLNYEYPPLGGGAANATAYILGEYSKIFDLEVDLVTSSIDGEYHLEKIGENISIHRLPIGKNKNNLHFQSQKDLLVYSWKAYFFSRKLAGKNSPPHQWGEKKYIDKNFDYSKIDNQHWCGGKYDLSHSFFTIPCGFISLLLMWQFKIPYIISLRGSDVPGYSDRFSFLYGFIKPLVRLIWKKSFAVVSNSQGLKELAFKTNSKQEIGVIYNGTDISDFIPKPEKRPADKIIITVGASRITARKGINYLLEAMKKLSSEYPNIFLRAMGDGNEKENLEKMAKELGLEKNVEFIGRVPRENTAPYYQEASIFVLPSLNEGMSNAMLEALSSGLPLIATDTGGTRELLEDGINGFIIKMKDSQDLADKIEILIKDGDLR